jgi:putative SOS response-associated peptidase YedK
VLTMCGRFSFKPTPELYARFRILRPSWDVEGRAELFPTNVIAVIMREDTPCLVPMRWGLIPHWAKDAAIGSKMINARVETLAEKPSFRNLLPRQRCVIPASGFYEWQGAKGAKTKYYITPQDEPYLTFAGLYDHWTAPNGETLTTCTIITTVADAFMSRLHHRMPVMLSMEAAQAWLDTAVTDRVRALAILASASAIPLQASVE